MADNRDSLRPYVADMAAVEKHILEAIERQSKDDDIRQFPDAAQWVDRTQGILRRHVTELESHLKNFDGGSVAGTVKEAVTGVLGVFAGLYDKVRKDTASRALRDDYTALSLAAISYTMLHTTALGLSQGTTAQLALANLKELTPLLVELSQLLPKVVLKELAFEGYTIETTVGEQATRNTHEAWQASNIGATASAFSSTSGTFNR
jgi:ferritin-like metal-binding protein YciE